MLGKTVSDAKAGAPTSVMSYDTIPPLRLSTTVPMSGMAFKLSSRSRVPDAAA